MEEIEENPQIGTVYNLQAKPLQFDATTLFVKNIQSYFTNEVFFSLMSENGRRVKMFELFPPKSNTSTTIALVTFTSQAEADDAIYWLSKVPPHRFILQYANDSIKEIKNFCNPWWSVACEEAYMKQRRAWSKYKNKPTAQNLDGFKKSKTSFRRVLRKCMKEYTEKVLYKKIKKEEEQSLIKKEYEPLLESESEKSNQEKTEIPPAKKIKLEDDSIKSKKESEPELEVEYEEEKHESEGICKEKTSNNTFSFSSSPNLEQIRQNVAKFAEERNWDIYHQPRNLVLALVGEVGELSELFQWKGEVQAGLPGWTDKEKQHLGEELSDVLIYLIRLSEKCNINLPSAVMKKISLNAEKYPANRVYGSSKKYTEY